MAAKRFCNLLPEELVEQILAKIQCTKTILRCTIVCKSWCSLIKSSQFMKTHLSYPNNSKYLLCEFGKNLSLCLESEPSKKHCTLVFPDKPDRRICIKTNGCCNGVICYTKSSETRDIVCLWNPSIRKLKVLPESRQPGRPDKAIGFWFDAEKNEYEVVKIGYTMETSFVEVYNLSSNSWKMVNETCPGAVAISDHNLVYVKGTLHWLSEQEGGRCIIVSLDMNTAKFREKLISDPCLGATSFYLTRAHADFLAILRFKFGPSKHGCTIEVYDENLMMFSENSYDVGGEYLNLVGCRNNGEALLVQLPYKNKILSYDFATKQFKDFCSSNQQHPSLVHRPFVKSLVLLNDGDVQTTAAPVSGKKFI